MATLPLIEIHFGKPTDGDIPVPDYPKWVAECLTCWGHGTRQYLGSFPSHDQAERSASLHRHTGRLGTGA